MDEMKSVKGLLNLIEEFYDASMSVCRISLEGKGQIQNLFLLRFGMLVIDEGVLFNLRLEAVRTINSILNWASKEERKKFSLSEDHCVLLQEFAQVILNVGDYEMQVAVSEALCRMTVKKCRDELVYKWFSDPGFGDSFKAINDREFETDCRKFLNEVNASFGDERRVFTFPCEKAFLDLTELLLPEDKNLDEFWIDFNIGTSCISFFVNDPEGTLWQSIHLPKDAVTGYTVLACDDQNILTVHSAIPIAHSKTKGETIQIIFNGQYDIGSAANRVYGSAAEWQRIQSEEQPTLSISETPPEELLNVQEASPCSTPEQADMAPVGQMDTHEDASLLDTSDTFQLEDHSDTEVDTSRSVSESHVRKRQSMSFVAALRKYQVARAKARMFSQSMSANGSIKSTPATGEKRKEFQKGERSTQRRESDKLDYTRKKPKTKSTLKILPLSSPSSADEPDVVKHPTPNPRSLEREEQGESSKKKPFCTPKDQSLDISTKIPTFPDLDSGFPEEIVLDDSGILTGGKDETSAKDPNSTNVTASPLARKRKTESTAPVVGQAPKKRQELLQEAESAHGLLPRRLFPSSPAETTTDMAPTMLSEDTESEAEMGSPVISAFQAFKSQLREHFSSRYKKIECRSLKSLTDCQNHVTSLLGTVHKQRLLHVERFQGTVLNELSNLERDCLTLQVIEKETVGFWRTELQSVASFCDKQQRRLESLELLQNDSTAREDMASSSPTNQRDMTTGENSENTASAQPPTKT